MAPNAVDNPILSRSIAVLDLPAGGLSVGVEADAQERAALARLNGLPAIHSLTAVLTLKPQPKAGILVAGEVRATVVQICVVSLDPFESEVIEPVEVHFLPAEGLAAWRAAHHRRQASAEPEENEPDEPDPIVNGRIDVGVLTGEYLALGLDPYPRKPGAAFEPPQAAAEVPDASPFAALEALKAGKS